MNETSLQTQVGIIGAGPAGLLLSQLLHLEGIKSVVIERRSLDYVLGRIRAGVLEQSAADVLRRAGAHERMEAEGLVHTGVELCFAGERHRIDFAKHRDASVIVYGQTEITKDLVDARRQAGGQLIYEIDDVRIDDSDSSEPKIHFVHEGQTVTLGCDFIAGCDGFHGVSRRSIPSSALKLYEIVYPFAWLGIMADTPPVSDELIYVNHARGFALCSMRSRTRSRCYVQCSPGDDIADWSDDAFWDELKSRLPDSAADKIVAASSIEKSIAPARSFVAEPLRHGRLFLAGDAAHIVPPTGAKGLNLAASDVNYLARALASYYETGNERSLLEYSDRALKRIWNAERFSWWFSTLLHRFPEHSDFDRRMQQAELEHLISSDAAQAVFTENYTGFA